MGRNKRKNSLMSLIHSLHVSFVVFLLGLVGIYLNRKNIILVLMSIELMLLGINLNLLSFSVSLDDLLGQVFCSLYPYGSSCRIRNWPSDLSDLFPFKRYNRYRIH